MSLNIPIPDQAGIIKAAAGAHGVPLNVMMGMYGNETGYGTNVTNSSAGAVGPFQFEPGTARSYNYPLTNMPSRGEFQQQANSAAKYLSDLFHQTGSWQHALAAYNAGPGNIQAGMGYANQALSRAIPGVWSNALHAAGSRGNPNQVIASRMAAALSTPSVTSTAPTSTPDYTSALEQQLLTPQHIDTSGKVSVPNILGNAISAAEANPTTTPAQTTVASNPSFALQGKQGNLGNDRVKVTPGKGDINPLGAGWTIGRTDQGVDANAKVGTPIRALNDSRVVRITPSWYAGQPLVLMQITSGPNTGKYWYVAEQIHQNLRVGQLLPKGSVVATYAPSGTGIEIGWGSPKTGGGTLAQATTGYTEGQQTPAGQNFKATELR